MCIHGFGYLVGKKNKRLFKNKSVPWEESLVLIKTYAASWSAIIKLSANGFLLVGKPLVICSISYVIFNFRFEVEVLFSFGFGVLRIHLTNYQ